MTQHIITKIDQITQEETVPTVEAGFPYRNNRYDLHILPDLLCPWHWHNDVEIFFMERGALIYHLPGKTQVFREGDVGFINAQVMHSTKAIGAPPSLQQEHIFLPRLVGGAPGSAIEARYVEPLLQNAAADLIFVPADHPWAERLRELMRRAFAAHDARAEGFEIVIRALMSELWLEFYRLAPEFGSGGKDDDNARIKVMLQFIAANYMDHVTLADIAASAQIGVRECCRCFKRQLNQTPFEYLLNFRIDRACEQLRGGARSITDICLACGFSSPSYFGKVFREKMGLSPRDYRKTAGRI